MNSKIIAFPVERIQKIEKEKVEKMFDKKLLILLIAVQILLIPLVSIFNFKLNCFIVDFLSSLLQREVLNEISAISLTILEYSFLLGIDVFYVIANTVFIFRICKERNEIKTLKDILLIKLEEYKNHIKDFACGFVYASILFIFMILIILIIRHLI